MRSIFSLETTRVCRLMEATPEAPEGPPKEPQGEMLNEETVEAARNFMIANINWTKLSEDMLKGPEVDPILALILAYGATFLTACNQKGIAPVSGLQAALLTLGASPTRNTTIH